MSQDKERLPAPPAPNSYLRNWLQIAIALAIAAPAPVIRTLELTGAAHLGLPPLVESALFGVAIFAAAPPDFSSIAFRSRIDAAVLSPACASFVTLSAVSWLICPYFSRMGIALAGAVSSAGPSVRGSNL